MTTLFLLWFCFSVIVPTAWFAWCGVRVLLAGDGAKSPEPRIVRQSFLASGQKPWPLKADDLRHIVPVFLGPSRHIALQPTRLIDLSNLFLASGGLKSVCAYKTHRATRLLIGGRL